MTPNHHPLTTGQPPPWAWGWGQDRYGVFTEIKVGEVVQRMRWIPPGSFWMGSPEDEAGRDSDEGPRHRVTLTEGFWLGDTPCTQALWEEVMGENPSRFQSPKRPVEQVSWNDCQKFFETLEERQPGIHLALPSEAQWEFACRCNTTGPTWKGEIELRGLRDAPALDEIAWYGGNSGRDFELGEGYDTKGWAQVQYPSKIAGTLPVQGKAPNPWGLYDMLGNVNEWCSDAWDRGDLYEKGHRVDPIGIDGPLRVYRGGSWYSDARNVRASYRNGFLPRNRFHGLGFRIARQSA